MCVYIQHKSCLIKIIRLKLSNKTRNLRQSTDRGHFHHWTEFSDMDADKDFTVHDYVQQGITVWIKTTHSERKTQPEEKPDWTRYPHISMLAELRDSFLSITTRAEKKLNISTT